MAYNTSNPVGSTDPRDLHDNAENLDEALNGEETTWVDRLGNTRKSFRAAEAAADAAEAAADNAVNNLIPADVQRVDAAADGAIADINALDNEAQQALDDAELSWESRFVDSQDDRETRFVSGQDDRETRFVSGQDDRESRFQQQLLDNGYQELGDYQAGLVIENLNQVVTVGDYMYRLAPTVDRPYTTSGDFDADRQDFVQIDFVTASQLATERRERQDGDAALSSQIVAASPLAAAERPIIQWHAQVIPASIIIPDNVNAFSAGPSLEIADGQSVTIGDDSHWTIVEGVAGNA